MSTLDQCFFRRMWATAWIIGLSGTPLVYSFRQTRPWVAAVPLAVGLAVFFLMEARRETWSALWEDLLSEGESVKPWSTADELREARSSVLVHFEQASGSSAFGQLDLFEKRVAPITHDEKGLSFIRSELGREHAFVTWHRFEELLLSEVIPDADRAADSALAKAFEHAPKSVARELAELMDKECREVMKQDFRNSAISLIAEGARRVALRLDSEAAAAAQAKKPTTTVQKRRTKNKRRLADG
ncbi:MAG: hypothetical protein ACR2NX_14510 [Chthoniobacterales bacterium]